MATVGTKLTIPFIIGASKIVGQGNQPELWAIYTTDDGSNTSPAWSDATQKVRSFSVDRGRESELQEFDAGTCSIVLDNRTRTFDPVVNSAITPMNRWWLREQFSGETHDLFKGYAESYAQSWATGGFSDAETTVTCADEVKVLALNHLPSTSPPRDAYSDVVQFDVPVGYWHMDDPTGTLTEQPAIGPLAFNSWSGGLSQGTPGAIVGEINAYVGIAPGNILIAGTTPAQGDPGDAAGLTAFTAEGWFAFGALEVNTFFSGPLPAAGNRQWWMQLQTNGTIQLQIHTATSTYTATSTIAVTVGPWHHLALVLGSNVATLYINGVSAATVATAGAIITGYTAGNNGMQISNFTGSATIGADEVAFYRYALGASRIQAHYDAGANRGFPQQLSDARFRAALDVSTSDAPRSWTTGVRTLQQRYMLSTQSPLDKIREAVEAEATEAAFFVKADGTLTFLASDHRSASPYNTVQATFDDDGTDLPYLDLGLDYSESFLFNDWNVTRDGGETQSASDTTSIARYFKRSQSLTGLALVDDTASSSIATAMLAKYKDPLTRIQTIAFDTTDTSVTEAVFRRELCDRIRIFRTPPGGGTRIDQTSFIQKIGIIGANDGKPWSINWGVSPL